MKYRDLTKFKTLNEAWGPHKALILLYETSEGYGHWVAVFEVGKGVTEFFDPYGMLFDSELQWVSEDFKESTGMIPWLTKLITEHGDCIYNDIQLQEFLNDTATCGRWAGLRVTMRDMPLEVFVKKFLNQTFKPDWYVTALTMFV
jgi:hypothetical protein